MKKGFILGSIVALIGVLIVCLTNLFGNGLNTDVDNKKIKKSIVMENTFDSVNLNSIDSCRKIDVKLSKDDKIYFEYYESKENTFNIEESNNLDITFVNDNNWEEFFVNIDFINEEYETTLYLPKDNTLNLTIQNKNASIKVLDILVSNIDISLNNGVLKMENITANNINTSIRNASSKINNIVANNIVIEGRNDYIEIEDVNCANIEVKNRNGRISFENVIAEKSISGITSNAKITFENIDFKNILDLETSNGSVKGDLKERKKDYSFDLINTKGYIKINQQKYDNYSTDSGNKKVKIKTKNSSIVIRTNE